MANMRDHYRNYWWIILLLTLPVLCGAEDIQLTGLGASFPQEVFQTWASAFENYRRGFVQVNMQYIGTGSGSAKRELRTSNSTVKTHLSYIASELALDQDDLISDPKLKAFPIISGAVVLGFNLPGVDSLNLTMDAVVGIYNGTIKHWNDSSISHYNTDVDLPGSEIRPCVRVDESGTTYIFTSALSNHSRAWRSQYGTFSSGFTIGSDGKETSTKWGNDTVKLFGRTNRAVSGIILSYAYSIGYMSVSEAVVAHISYARIVDNQGNHLELSKTGLKAAMTMSMDIIQRTNTFNVDLVDHVQPGTYPIIGYSYFVTNTERVKDCDAVREFVRYVDWILTEPFAEQEAGDFRMAVPPIKFDTLVTERVLKNMYCGGQNLYDLMTDQKYAEHLSQQTWRLPVMIISPIVGVVVLCLIGYTGYQQLKLRNAILSDNWKITSSSLKLSWSRKWGHTHAEPGSSLSVAVTAASTYSAQPSGHVAAIGLWKGQKICLRDLLTPNLQVSRRDTKKNLIVMRDNIHHLNVLRFFGICYMDEGTFIVSEHAPRGTISDVVQNDKYRIDDNIKFSLAIDIAAGMNYLHDQGIVHGMLAPQCCLLDAKWNIKISDWEHGKLEYANTARKRSQIMPITPATGEFDIETTDLNIISRAQFWTAPEVLRSSDPNPTAQRAGDIYSFSIILVEIFLREDPYSELFGLMEPVGIIEAVISRDIRPSISTITNTELTSLILEAWDTDPLRRQPFNNLMKSLKSMRPTKKSVMDCMMETLEGYIGNLEERVEERTAELASANKGLQNLLHQILPPSVADRLAVGESVPPEQFESVSIYFSDIVGFTSLCEASTPLEVVGLLNDLYHIFDWIIERHDVYKVETIGDAYMVISGLPNRNGVRHAAAVATMALDLVSAVRGFEIRHRPNEKLRIRAGVHSGPVVAGVVGSKMPRYCLFGDTVNTASRMESTSESMRIQVSQSTQDLLLLVGGFTLESRGQMQVKGKGMMTTYFLQGLYGYKPQSLQNMPTSNRGVFVTSM